MPRYLAIILTILAVIVLIAGAWWFLTTQQAGAPPAANTADTTQTETPNPTANNGDEAVQGITIVFTDSGFEASTYSVTAGQTVTVKNDSSMSVEFSSDEHPTHTDNPELNMQVLEPGEQGSITPQNPGSWGIHDHEHPEFTTTLTVTE